MNAFVLCLALTGVVIITIGSIFSLARHLNEANIKIEELDKELQRQICCSAYLIKHAEEFSKIVQNKEDLIRKINGAKTDEELAEILAIVINSNNAIVQDCPAKK